MQYKNVKKLSERTKLQQELPGLLFFPCFLFWCELLLRLFSDVGLSISLLPAALAAAGTGSLISLLLWLISRISRRAALITGLLLAAPAALLFTIESMIRTIFTTYMTPSNLAVGADNVIRNYGNEFRRAFFAGMGRFVLFLLPLIVFLLFRFRFVNRGKTSLDPDAEDTAVSSDILTAADEADTADAPVWRLPALLLVFGLLLTGSSSAAARAGASAPLYSSQYSYHAAVEAFGLLTASRLDLQYSLLGNPSESFSLAGPGSAPGSASALASGSDTSHSERMPAASPASAASLSEVSPSETSSGPAQSAEDPSQASADPVQAVAAPGVLLAEGIKWARTPSDALRASPASFGDNAMDLDFTAEALNQTKKTRELSAYLSTLTPSKKNPYTGLFAGKNLILVCAESYCDRFIRPELTPTLWRLTHNGIYFEEYYQSEWGGSTTTGELAFLTGLCGNDGDDSLSGIADNNHYFTMGNQLQRLGYSSLAFHTGSRTYYKRHTTHENLGYNQYLANENGMKKLLGRSYAPDSLLIDKTTDLYFDHQPFSIYYMTISGHAPYEKNHPFVWQYYDQVNKVLGDEYQEKTKYYICYQMELEAAMKLLVERLEEAGIADNTVIALTGDHYPYGLGGVRTWQNDKDYIQDLLHGSDFFRWEEDRSGLIIWSGCLEHQNADMACTVTEPVGNLDILPTLSNLFGLDYDSRLLPGRDVFAPDVRPLVWWNNLSFVTTEGKYDGRKGIWIPNEGYEKTLGDQEFLGELQRLVNDRLLMARLIMQTDYYGLLFGEDDVRTAGDILWEPEDAAAKKQ